MCRLKGINFGYADSEKELINTPELFDEAFVDPKQYLTRLINGDAFLVLGRKGSGKTAYGAKICRISQLDPDIFARSCSLSDLNYISFEKHFADNSVKGGRRFLGVWKYLLLLEILQIILDSIPNQENKELNSLCDVLKDQGVIPSKDIVHTVKKVKKSGFSINITPVINASLEHEYESVVSDPDLISEIILRTLKECCFGECKFYFIIDGLDDVLRGVQFSSDIITGLLRAASELNTSLKYTDLNANIIVLLRTDIFQKCRDPDLTKIRRDSSINLAWTREDLTEIVFRRIKAKYPRYHSFEEFWGDYAPKYFSPYESKRTERGKKTINLIFELTLYRPRDILQFFIECQNMHVNAKTIDYLQLSEVIKSYSQDYFASEMMDELTGFLDDSIVTVIPQLFSENGKRMFWIKDLEDVNTVKQYSIDIRQLLEVMYNAGYVGQIRIRDRGRRDFSFKHYNPNDQFSSKDQCVIHRGLIRAFNVN